MSQDDVVNKIVSEFREDPRNKIIINAHDLAIFANEEVGREVSIEELCKSISSIEDGTAEENEEALLDAATALCHEVADRCWGECVDEDDDEWEEVDIGTEWSNVECEDPSSMFVTVYQT